MFNGFKIEPEMMLVGSAALCLSEQHLVRALVRENC